MTILSHKNHSPTSYKTPLLHLFFTTAITEVEAGEFAVGEGSLQGVNYILWPIIAVGKGNSYYG